MNKWRVFSLVVMGLGVGCGVGVMVLYRGLPKGAEDDRILATSMVFDPVEIPPTIMPTPKISVAPRSFGDGFDRSEVLQEAGKMRDSASKEWWLNSGGELRVESGKASTIKDDLPDVNKWRLLYSFSNSLDTNNGYNPQNIFRLVTRSAWRNFVQEVRFRILDNNLVDSPQRNESNGVLLFNRYVDGQNLYYTGLRVDGGVVVKKKLKGTYYTLGYKQIFAGKYDRVTSPNLLPVGEILGVRSQVLSSGEKVKISVAVLQASGEWKQILEVVDDGFNYGQVISGAGYAGIRTDFMDVELDEYRIEEI